MSPGRHRSGAAQAPSPVAFAWRLPREARLPVASVGVAVALLGTATVAASLWPDPGSEAPTATLTGVFASPRVSAASLQAVAELRADERTSRDRTTSLSATPFSTTSARSATALGQVGVGTGPGRAPAATKDGALGSATAAGLSDAPCPISSSIETHLTANARAVYRSVCAAFHGTVSAFGGYRAGSPGDHGTGRAVDIMVSGDPGLAIARYVQDHATALHVTYVIYQQRIWMAGDPITQWKPMADRGSRTANHFDHVHVSVS